MAVFVLIGFNVMVFGVLARLAMVADLRKALREKGPIAEGDSTSYSRLTGLAGAAMVTALYWAVGNLALSKAFAEPAAAVKDVIQPFVPLFLIGSALFLPYAFNQIKSAFGVVGMGAAALKAAGEAGTAAGLGLGPPAVPLAAPLTILVVNVSTSIGDAEFAAAVAAVGVQVAQHFGPAWGAAATLVPARQALNGLKVNVDGVVHAVIYVGEASSDPTTGVAGAYGYHSLTHGALPYAFVYLDVCAKAKEPWSVTLSHEVLELLADPNTLTTVSGPAPNGAPGQTVRYDLEVCDPTQGDHYEIDGVPVSNFVTKAYFGLTPAAQATNHLGLPLAPFGVRPLGYIQYEDLLGAQQVNGPRVDRARIAARTMLAGYRRNARRTTAFRNHV
ncbi:MAG: hypothetical protein JF588_17125 [Caulobacterales bacterium]|nr:hypothetical protein [Caulobacterales bacterium]